MAWMDLKDHAIEVVIGPYEVYEDEMFNYKAAFESFVTIMDPVESEKLEVFGSYLNDIEKIFLSMINIKILIVDRNRPS